AAGLVVLDAEDVQSLERVCLGRHDLVELLNRGADGVFEQREQQFVLAVEVLVEAAQRLPGLLDDLLDGEVLAALHQVERGIEEALHPGFRASPSRIQHPCHGKVAAGRAGDGPAGRLLLLAHGPPRSENIVLLRAQPRLPEMLTRFYLAAGLSQATRAEDASLRPGENSIIVFDYGSLG